MLGTLSPAEQQRAGLLVVAKRRATGLLVAVTAVFVVATVLVSRAPWLSWIQATAVASMVGGLADWFAVTALFRRPLGLPIPHTAIVVERKDRFAETLGAFVQESFLTPDAVSERLRATDAVARSARWLADPGHADELAGRLADALVTGSELLRDDDVHQVLVALGRERLDRIALSPLAGRVLRELTRDRRHDPIVDAALEAAGRYLAVHGADLRDQLGFEAPWWLPGPLEGRMVERLVRQAQTLVSEMAANHDHPGRRRVDAALSSLADNLEHSPDLRARGEALKADLLNRAQIRDVVAGMWSEAKVSLRAQAEAPRSALRQRLAELIAQTGGRLRDDEELAASAQRGLDTVVRTVLERFDSELARLVSGTIARWDAAETSRRLELLLGPDLQYIRINGTIVGALAGLGLHGLSRLIG